MNNRFTLQTKDACIQEGFEETEAEAECCQRDWG